ncbi:MAG: hypothetical protein KC684_07395 [Candidatus Omnitrophica bacterium]|nr:hypothetical protein [Candidatus Omnitrophota bacterium]
MKKIVLLVICGVVTGMVCAGALSAQMVDYSKLKAKKAESEAKKPESEASKEALLEESVEKDALPAKVPVGPEFFMSAPKVTNRMEQLYDMNEDNILQSNELGVFLKDVVATIEKKGSFEAQSEILQLFDNNKDMKITKAESAQITILLKTLP